MIYNNIKIGKFISRPNRFIAHIEIEGQEQVCHVKNTGRCRELLVPNATVFVEEFSNPNRKTNFDLIAVYKEERLINMDSQAPNKVFAEWLHNNQKKCKTPLFKNITFIKPECKQGNSRFDFYIEANGKKIFIEIKGVTLEEDGVVLFPDAPTERGLKHVKELSTLVREGYDAYVVFIIQMENVKYFTPNMVTHPAFGYALKSAQEAGVKIIALDCKVTKESIYVNDFVKIEI